MARQAMTNGFLSCFMHVGLALVLLAYLPVAFVCRLVYRLLVRPFVSGEDLRGKVVLVTGASSGIGEVSQFIMFLMSPARTSAARSSSSPAKTSSLPCTVRRTVHYVSSPFKYGGYARFHGVPFVE
jgi:hypothetical protein